MAANDKNKVRNDRRAYLREFLLAGRQNIDGNNGTFELTWGNGKPKIKFETPDREFHLLIYRYSRMTKHEAPPDTDISSYRTTKWTFDAEQSHWVNRGHLDHGLDLGNFTPNSMLLYLLYDRVIRPNMDLINAEEISPQCREWIIDNWPFITPIEGVRPIQLMPAPLAVRIGGVNMYLNRYECRRRQRNDEDIQFKFPIIAYGLMDEQEPTHELREDGTVAHATHHVYDLWNIWDVNNDDSINGYDLAALWKASFRTPKTIFPEDDPNPAQNIYRFRSFLPEDLEDSICFLMGVENQENVTFDQYKKFMRWASRLYRDTGENRDYLMQALVEQLRGEKLWIHKIGEEFAPRPICPGEYYVRLSESTSNLALVTMTTQKDNSWSYRVAVSFDDKNHQILFTTTVLNNKNNNKFKTLAKDIGAGIYYRDRRLPQDRTIYPSRKIIPNEETFTNTNEEENQQDEVGNAVNTQIENNGEEDSMEEEAEDDKKEEEEGEFGDLMDDDEEEVEDPNKFLIRT